VDELKRAGEVVHKALKYAIDIVQPDMPVLELCEKVEAYIRASGLKPAFPVNVGIGEVAAHYTAKRGDSSRIPKSGVVKIDVGAHYEGYVVDAAITISLGTPIYDGLIKAAKNALHVVSDAVRPGVKAWQLGKLIERVIKDGGFKPIYNLTGHRIEKYNLHAGDVIPNYADKSASQELRSGDIYAIEPFATNGIGYVKELNIITIYKLNKFKYKEFQNLINIIYNEIGPLPFSPRWFPQIPENEISRAHKAGVLHGYEALVEKSGGIVAQFEDTFLVTEDGSIPLGDVLGLL